jgi:predicted ester cyclase
VQTFARERRAGTVPDETLHSGTVFGLDAHRRVDAEAARALPHEHADGIELVEESVAAEIAKDARR